MRLFAAGTQPVAVIAIGVNANGVIAIGPLACGVIAIGQLARGVLAIGQLSVGLLSVGQLAVSPLWVVGMLGVGATSGGGMLVAAPFGDVPVTGILRGHPRYRPSGPRWWAVPLVLLAAVLWWFAAGAPLLHHLTRVGGIFRQAPRVLR
jgi:hypothetical protein